MRQRGLVHGDHGGGREGALAVARAAGQAGDGAGLPRADGVVAQAGIHVAPPVVAKRRAGARGEDQQASEREGTAAGYGASAVQRGERVRQ